MPGRFDCRIDRARRRSLDNVELDFHQLADFALHINELRRFAPAAIEQAVGRHNARYGRRFWLTHNMRKRSNSLLRILTRERSNFCWR
jgi:hypothetical protein